eukprot:CAMPEP_0178483268 /NCGR_PEP_ID=MMETSP0696-20121128/7147_1 /TAXON_ID=265572 /ORGANISM="Extubocellulus spinifer, Strain CCMP396" /LENGTH=238 /DNA_ID=CAMNT_0020110781 /DNA_START=221 /DNA_END=937 /DNA_ORIENTATION=+
MPNRVSDHDDQVNLLRSRRQQQQHRQLQQNFARTTAPAALFASGGAQVDASAAGNGDSIDMTIGKFLASFWGTGGFVYILLRSIRKIVPIAMEPFGDGAVALNRVQLVMYILTCLWFAYVEGYKGFQCKFSPLVVSRSLTLHPRSPPHHLLLAPLYSMGLFHATKKRVIVSWSVSLGVAALVAGVKRMPYPWRNIVDAGVVVGLTWGMLSILVGYVLACAKGVSPADPALPEEATKKD